MLHVNNYNDPWLETSPLLHRLGQDDPSPDDGRYLCTVYVHGMDEQQYLFVCEHASFPDRLRETEWRVLAYGVSPPLRAKPWLKLNGYYQMWHDTTSTRPF